MKKLIILAIFMAVQTTMFATVWRLNNRPGTDADFTSLQQAHDAVFQGNQVVQPGDTLYLEASSGSYGNLVATKKLVIIGAGFFNALNPETQADFNTSVVGTITFNGGSQGSSISGCSITNIVVNTSEIVIERNFFYIESHNSHAVRLNANNISNIIIRNNYIRNNNSETWHGNQPNRVGNCITATHSNINSVIIMNNYLQVQRIHEDKKALELGIGFSGIVENNVIFGNTTVHNCTFANNILREGSFSHSNTLRLHNIGNTTQFGYSNGNQSNINMNDVFVGSGSTDGRWQLKEGSPAIGAGVGGTDCGMFGGETPWVLSGIPKIPAIYQLDLNVDNVNQQIEVEMSVKSRN